MDEDLDVDVDIVALGVLQGPARSLIPPSHSSKRWMMTQGPPTHKSHGDGMVSRHDHRDPLSFVAQQAP